MPNDTEKGLAPLVESLTLGKTTAYPEHYAPELLQPVPRVLNRNPLGVQADALPFVGADRWTCYELSWLNNEGVPRVAIAEVTVPATSTNLIESKSFKLYLNSFNQTRVASERELINILTKDLSTCAGAPVIVQMFSIREYTALGVGLPNAHCIDEAEVENVSFAYQPEQLQADTSNIVTEALYTDLLKSNCLITNQPDWGTLCIQYTGPQIDRGKLLSYVIGFRNHNEFHEQCVERIFIDLGKYLKPHELCVEARYTRRGGLDINPWRATTNTPQLMPRLVRQ
ncbi:MAG: 7-cyano-7-deazaguanine reductase QueF [Idiomarinaceae bacterium HL-53]|nr:MAG: 7-cyano-7-deazaguanine reductase QueF [Idiomarinaceae bacterium HL-53]CUS49287.1 7-cyano-7-deazaguanine reductase [Idiomarinaceae bacterium HL-53]